MECKFWLHRDSFNISEAFSYNLTPRERRNIRKIILEHFEYIEEQWDEFKKEKLMKKHHNITELKFTTDKMILSVDEEGFEFLISDISERLLRASSEERNHFEISPSGYGIHWPLIDEDLSIDGLLRIVHSPQNQKLSA